MTWTPTRMGWAEFDFDPARDGTQVGLAPVKVPVRRILPYAVDHATGQVALWRLEEYRGGAWVAAAQARSGRTSGALTNTPAPVADFL